MLSSCPYDPCWPIAERNKWVRRLHRRIEDSHPWGTAALVLSGGKRTQAQKLLESWMIHGIKKLELTAIWEAPDEAFTGLSSKLDQHDQLRPMPQRLRVLSIGLELHDWQLHAWINQINIAEEAIIESHVPSNSTAIDWPLMVMQFEAIVPYSSGTEQIYQLYELAHAHIVYDVDRDRVELLRRLGVNSKHLTLDRDIHDSGHWLGAKNMKPAITELGLPKPENLQSIGETLILGCSTERGWVDLVRPPLMALPGFTLIETPTPIAARGLAAWILEVLKSDMRVVRINPTDHEIRKRGFACLAKSSGKQVHGFIDPIHPDELVSELKWRSEGCKPPSPLTTPKPNKKFLWSSDRKKVDADATVCISLYNYAHTIINALESTKSQHEANVDLIVVDDHSTDGGDLLVRTWLESNHGHYNQAILLKHMENGGLAAARNTALEHARTEWCFILDADNVLHPDAIHQCLELTRMHDRQLAVVHPFIEKNECVEPRVKGMVSVHSWQRDRFIRANYVDAMALVNRSAWKDVGGYQHFPYGWEDYDFWCSLIDKGYYGVVCPQILATYTVHDRSMLRTYTQRSIRETSRRLQMRHPWLQLETANGILEGDLQ